MTASNLTDALGQTFDLEHPYERIVSLVPSLTETLYDLGCGERLVGRTDYCIHPADAVATVASVGGAKTPNIEAVLALKPDLVLMDQDENRRADAEALIAAGVQVFGTAPRSVQDALNLLWDLTILLGITTQAGTRIQAIERAYDWTWSAFQSLAPMRIFCPIWPDPWMTFNADTYPHDLLRTCGAENVFADREARYPCVTLDQVTGCAPDLILLPNEPFAFTAAEAAELKAHPSLAKTPVRFLDGSLLFWPGTRLARALAELPSLLHP
jgi:ABC-type Fe3+-hydroxamate transport system substrate-binding protein